MILRWGCHDGWLCTTALDRAKHIPDTARIQSRYIKPDIDMPRIFLSVLLCAACTALSDIPACGINTIVARTGNPRHINVGLDLSTLDACGVGDVLGAVGRRLAAI